MAQIVINEVSQNYTFNVNAAAYATVALPITASWGPAYLDPESVYGSDSNDNIDAMMDSTQWYRFSATQEGMESFLSTFRGPASNFRIAKDYSYQQAITLLSAGYDVLVCRVCPGAQAGGAYTIDGKTFSIKAKYAGSFGNNLRLTLSKVAQGSWNYWSLVTYISDSSGGMTAAENLVFVFDSTNPAYTDGDVPHVSELESAYLVFNAPSYISDAAAFSTTSITLAGGSDVYTKATDPYGAIVDDAQGKNGNVHLISTKYYALTLRQPDNWSGHQTDYFTCTSTGTTTLTWDKAAVTGTPDWAPNTYYKEFDSADAIASANATAVISAGRDLAGIRYNVTNSDANITSEGYFKGMHVGIATEQNAYWQQWNTGIGGDAATASALVHMEWCYNAAFLVYQLLKDKLNYNPQRIISPGWDDMNLGALSTGTEFTSTTMKTIAPLHEAIMDAAFFSRCATGYIDIPKSVPRSLVYNASTSTPGYAQMLSRHTQDNAYYQSLALANLSIYSTHSALFTCWTQYRMVGMNKMTTASPGFVALLIQRAEILNQASQYEWALPVDRKHNLAIGKMDYTVPEKLRQVWQKLEGVGVNILTFIPDYNINIWGNSTLFEVPPATYQALANLSTRFLVNAIEDVVYRVGIGITWQYNNEQAYSAFYAGVSPILDTMKQLGAIDGYKMQISADIDSTAHVNANTIIGKIWLVVNGVINDIYVDLIALPQGTSLESFGQ